jgi:metallophosphoesterase (TIGR00282 family)
MSTNVLFFGDTIGKPARLALLQELPKLRAEYQADFVVVNVENITHGKGVTEKALAELDPLGIDVYTSGNHAFDKGEFSSQAFRTIPNLIRPSNYGRGVPGKGWVRVEKKGKALLVMNLNAQVFFDRQFMSEISSPFKEFDTLYADEHKAGDAVLVDFHAEATSEKRALGFYADGRASMVFGTHTHVATADLQILPHGTAYVSDCGMTGALHSILGVPIQNSLDLFLGNTPRLVFEVEEQNPIMVNAVYAEIENGIAVKTEKIYREVNVG